MRDTMSIFLVMVISTATFGKNRREPTAPPALPICSVLSKATEYDGKEITARGIYVFEIHGSEFFGRDCDSRERLVNFRLAANYKSDKQAAKVLRNRDTSMPVDMVIRGRFSIAKNGCFGAACDLFEIEAIELLWAQPEHRLPQSEGISGSGPSTLHEAGHAQGSSHLIRE